MRSTAIGAGRRHIYITHHPTIRNKTGVWKKLWLLCASFLLIPGHPFLLISASLANPTTTAAAANSVPASAPAVGEAAAASVPPTAPGGNKFQSAIKGLQQRQQDVRGSCGVVCVYVCVGGKGAIVD